MGEGAAEQKPRNRWQRWTRVLLLSFLFFLLIGMLLYYVVPSLVFPLRRDSIPSGAYIVPWMQPSSPIKTLSSMGSWDIDTTMAGALFLNVTFEIDASAFNQTRRVQSTIYLGHDEYYLYVGGRLRGMFKNPASNPTLTLANYFQILLDVTNDGKLSFPETGSALEVYVNPESDLRTENGSWRTGIIWTYSDLVWSRSFEMEREVWRYAEDYYSPKAQPESSLSDFDVGYEKADGTVVVLFSRYLSRSQNAETNALQMRQGERWVMGFLFELGYDNWQGIFEDFVDGWPKKTYPYLSNDASWWPKLVIDLANPPANL